MGDTGVDLADKDASSNKAFERSFQISKERASKALPTTQPTLFYGMLDK